MYRRIFVAIDGSGTSQRALDHALQLGGEQHARVRVVHAIEWVEHLAMSFSGGYPVDLTEYRESMREEGERMLSDAKARAGTAGVEVETATLEGADPRDRTARLLVRDAKAWGADLIVLGTHGRTGVDRFVLGSVAESVLHTAHRPVLLIQAE